MEEFDVVIAGSGHSGAQAAVSLRQAGFTGTILMVGREVEFPYERPPLSKDYLADEKPFERLLIRPIEFWQRNRVEIRRGLTVTQISPAGRQIFTDDGGTIGYRKLIWAAGGFARRLECPGAKLRGIHAIRSKGDVDRLKSDVSSGANRALIVGGGYIGLEASAALRKIGCEVVLLECANRVLSRVAGEEISRFFEAEHRRHSVHLHLSTALASLQGDVRVSSARTTAGEDILCDLVVVGIGIVPAVAPLIAAGASGADAIGVEVNEYCQTSLPDVYAIGDCAAHVSAFGDGRRLRVESVQNAHHMAATAAKAICGVLQPYRHVPWFWSNQYDIRLKTVGLCTGYDVSVVRGHPAERSFSVVYLRQNRVIALDCVNRTKDYVQARALVEAHASPDLSALADPTRPLKELLTD